jgi:cytochrome c biogenesis protein CcmG/thiol:disulfide interchange protein DsbE
VTDVALGSEAPPRRRRRLIWAWVAVAVAAVAGVSALVAVGSAGTGRSRSAPQFTLPALADGAPPVRLADYRGRPVVVNFFASWCTPCKREMPAFARIARELDGRVAFIGVNHQDSRRLARQLVAETGVDYPTGYDPDGTVARSYRLVGMPTTVFVAPDGRLLATHAGEISAADLRATIRRLFGV